MSGPTATPLLSEMLRPPVNRAMRVLDRSLFHKTVPLAAARVYENSNIAPFRKTLASDILDVERVITIKPDPTQSEGKNDRKAILLRPEIEVNGRTPRLCLYPALIQHYQIVRHGVGRSKN